MLRAKGDTITKLRQQGEFGSLSNGIHGGQKQTHITDPGPLILCAEGAIRGPQYSICWLLPNDDFDRQLSDGHLDRGTGKNGCASLSDVIRS